ncbi:DEAD/DEAH box helicase family protein [Pyxidicoccus sp. 3LFB2]
MISVQTAGELLHFGGRISDKAAQGQLEGAVALHNLLDKHGVAYLADEVGMGKTYVALGALALFRHFQPNFRVLILAPRANIQKKWGKELQNFVANNVRFPDLRVKALHGTPARSVVLCESLLDLVTQTSLDPDRDFIARLPSFSLAVSEEELDSDGRDRKAGPWRKLLPWLDSESFGGRGKGAFKDAVGRAACCALPTFDLVIVDEGHNLKAGLKEGVAARNRVLALAMGHPDVAGDPKRYKGYGPRATRVLFLSATPVEDDYLQLWNQLQLFGKGEVAPELKDSELPAEVRQAAARRFLIRRVTSLEVGGETLTKNLYRREWREGGVAQHDEPLPEAADPRARLAVALVQKKVSEVIGARFNHSFQIGMLASFESFLETAKVESVSDESEGSNFDQVDQTENLDEREGVDVESINQLARNYRKKFGTELPHPKMDGLVDTLAGSFDSGEKALVFVRRVASVKELQRKLEDRYDQWLMGRLKAELAAELWPRLEASFQQYRAERIERRDRLHGHTHGDEDGTSGLDSFFAWYFRGDGPSNILSGAAIAKRFGQAGALQSTFFEDNQVARVLEVRPGGVLAALREAVAMDEPRLLEELKARAARQLRKVGKHPRRNLFLAYQHAAISLLAEQGGALRAHAEDLRQERYGSGDLSNGLGVDPGSPAEWLELSTFWTDLRERPKLAALWPATKAQEFRARFREEELRRELLSTMVRLGNPLIDLYVLVVNRLGTLELRAREAEDAASDLSKRFLDLLEAQSERAGHHSYRELSLAATYLDLILDTNFPALRQATLADVPRELGKWLKSQMPVGGMFGAVNDTVVRQFRMPGYPFVLFTTDLLQEGEDLHTFCSRVYHYGISWMPSSMEQRVGRVDRVSSETERRLDGLGRTPSGGEKLQVFYPHLRQTVEVLQVQRVLSRLDTFIRMMHEDLAAPAREQRHIDMRAELLRHSGRPAPPLPAHPLRSAFEILPAMLGRANRKLAVTKQDADALTLRFQKLREAGLPALEVTWEAQHPRDSLLGTVLVLDRKQPFTLLARSLGGHLLIRCISPVGRVLSGAGLDEIAATAEGHAVRLSVTRDERFDTYDVAVEVDVILAAPRFDGELVASAVRRATTAADQLERTLLQIDAPLDAFRENLEEEPRVAR